MKVTTNDVAQLPSQKTAANIILTPHAADIEVGIVRRKEDLLYTHFEQKIRQIAIRQSGSSNDIGAIVRNIQGEITTPELAASRQVFVFQDRFRILSRNF